MIYSICHSCHRVTMPAMPLKLFLPHTCLESASGMLIGWHDNVLNITCVVCISHSPDNQQLTEDLCISYAPIKPPTQQCHETPADKTSEKALNLNKGNSFTVLGLWKNSRKGSCHLETKRFKDNWLIVSRTGSELPNCKYALKNDDQVNDIIIVIFNACELLSSCELTNPTLGCHMQKRNVESLIAGLTSYQNHITNHQQLTTCDKVTHFVPALVKTNGMISLLFQVFQISAKLLGSVERYYN